MSVVIRVEHLSKRYRLGSINRRMLYEDMQRFWARMRGRPVRAEIGDVSVGPSFVCGVASDHVGRSAQLSVRERIGFKIPN